MVKPLVGWKEIASAIGVSVRTAQTLRITHGLPVANLTARTVFVERAAIAAWLRDVAQRSRAGRATSGA